MKRPLLLAVCSLIICVLSASMLQAVPQETYKFRAPAGTSIHELGSHTIRVESTARVTVYVVFTGSQVTGAVEPLEVPALVTITVIENQPQPDEIIFHGHVKRYTPFEFLFPHETGHGEG